MLSTVNIFFNIFIDGVLPRNTGSLRPNIIANIFTDPEANQPGKKKNKIKRMEAKGKYENRELLLIYIKIKTPSKELLNILKNRELMVNPSPCSKIGLVPAKLS